MKAACRDSSDIDKSSLDSPIADSSHLLSNSLESIFTTSHPCSNDATEFVLPVAKHDSESNSTIAFVDGENKGVVDIQNESNDGKDDRLSACIVCQKKFKSKSCMNKHLRSVHTGSLNSFLFIFLSTIV